MSNYPPRKTLKTKEEILASKYLEFSDTTHKPGQPFLLDLVTLEKLFFQSLPKELIYQPTANWVAILTPGRNNAVYQYTGSEDILEFTLSWYGDDQWRSDVLRKCKWLEALTKNDGYDNPPHPVLLAFGRMFKGSKWIVEKASSNFSLFNREYNMLPQLAITEITLKRIHEGNRRRSEILNLNT